MMNSTNNNHGTEDPVELVLRALARGASTCAVTLAWAIAMLLSDIWLSIGWLGLLLPCLIMSLLFISAMLFPVERVREGLCWALPVWGDVLRYQKRKARKKGNAWLREAGLVHDSAVRKRPAYRIYLWPDGLEIEDLPVVGVTDDRLRRAVTESLAAWHAADYELHRTGNSSWHVRLYEESRLDTLKAGRQLSALPETLGRIDGHGNGHLLVRIGRDLDGDAWIDFSGVSGVLLAGLPGAGKTSAANVIVSGLLSRPDLAEVYILDGKGGTDWEWAKPYCAGWSNDDHFGEGLTMVRQIHGLMMERLRTNGERFGDSNAWHSYGRTDLKAICFMVDELQSYTSPAVLNRETKVQHDEFLRLLTDIVKKGRSACVFVIAATQKPTSDAIPTGLRDVMARRYAFHVSTPEMAKACLGDIPDGEPSPMRIAFEDKGLAVTNTDSGGTAYVRFDYLPERDIPSLLSGNDTNSVE